MKLSDYLGMFNVTEKNNPWNNSVFLVNLIMVNPDLVTRVWSCTQVAERRETLVTRLEILTSSANTKPCCCCCCCWWCYYMYLYCWLFVAVDQVHVWLSVNRRLNSGISITLINRPPSSPFGENIWNNRHPQIIAPFPPHSLPFPCQVKNLHLG